MPDLVIVESPAKAKTIEKILGKGYTVKASVGHVRDLPPKRLGVDLQDSFTPEYIVIRGKAKVLDELRSSAKRAGKIYLAPDPDRDPALVRALEIPATRKLSDAPPSFLPTRTSTSV